MDTATTLHRTELAPRWLATAGAVLIAGPVLFEAGYVLHPDLPQDIGAAVAEAADVRTQLAAAKVMVAFGGLLIIALIATWRRHLVPARGRTLATVGLGLAAVGHAWNALSQATHGYLLYWASAPGVDRAAGVAVITEAESSTALVTLPVSFFSIPVLAVGMLLVAVALWRAGTVPRWVPVALVLAGVVGAAFGTGPAMLVALALDVAASGTALVFAARRAAGPGMVVAA